MTEDKLKIHLKVFDSLTLAIKHKHIEIVRVLLQEAKIDPSKFHSVALIKACESGDETIVKMIYENKQVDPTAKAYTAFVLACMSGNPKIVDLFVKDMRVKLEKKISNAYFEICRKANAEEVLKLLISTGKFDPSLQQDEALKSACLMGHLEVVKMLLADVRINPTADKNQILVHAAKGGRVEIMQLLLADKRFDLASYDEALAWAENNGHEDVYILLKKRKLQVKKRTQRDFEIEYPSSKKQKLMNKE